MFEYLFGLLGIGGIGFGVAAWFVGLPAILGIINNLLSIVSPFLKGFSELVVWYTKELFDGVKTMLSNSSTFVVLFTVAVVAGIWGSTLANCEPTKTAIVKEDAKPPKFSLPSKWDSIFDAR
jgi:hypothetical protein